MVFEKMYTTNYGWQLIDLGAPVSAVSPTTLPIDYGLSFVYFHFLFYGEIKTARHSLMFDDPIKVFFFLIFLQPKRAVLIGSRTAFLHASRATRDRAAMEAADK